MKHVTSFTNPTIRRIRSLYTRKTREKDGLAVLEGTRLVQDALESGVKFHECLCSLELYETGEGRNLADSLAQVGAKVIIVPEELIRRISDTTTPQGIIAVVEAYYVEFSAVIEKGPSVVLLLDRVQDPGNVGTLIRSAAAAGADCVALIHGTADMYNPKTLRASMGAAFRIPVAKVDDADEAIRMLKQKKIDLVVADAGANIPFYQGKLHGRICLVVGNEANGVSDKLLRSADVRIQIPMLRGVESLNVAMAGSILLYEAYRQRIERQGRK